MPKLFKAIQNNFLAGELSPRMRGRSDFQKYSQGVATLENYLVMPHGGVMNRPGTMFVAEVKNSANQARLIDFQFSTTQSYILEFGNLYFRIYKDNGRIESPPGTPVEVVTTYLHTDLAKLHYAQTADTLYLVHTAYPPRKITRTSHTAWSIADVDFIDGPYMKENTDTAKTLTVSSNAVGTGRTMTASGTLTFSSDQVGGLWRIKGNTTYGYVKITAFTNSTNVTVDVKKTLDFTTPGTSTTSVWREGAWSTKQGFPGSLSFFENRLMFGGAPSGGPQTIWGSISNSYEDMTPGVNAGDALDFTLVDNRINVIQWLSQSRTMIAGTAGNEFSFTGASGAALTPTNPVAKSQTTIGSTTIQPVRIAQTTLFVQRAAKKLYQLSYNFDSDAYLAPDLTLLSEHITGTGLKYLSWKAEPDSLLWGVRLDGQLCGLTYLPLQDVFAWQRHMTDGLFESVATIPDVVNNVDQTWCVVYRQNATKRYVEYFDPTLYADAVLTYDGTNTTATLTPAATTGVDVVFTASIGSFAAGDVGKDIVLAAAVNGVSNSRARITVFTDTTHVKATITTAFPNTNPIPASSWGLATDTFGGISHLNGKSLAIRGDGATYPASTVSAGVFTLATGSQFPLKVQAGLAFTPKLVTLPPELTMRDGVMAGRKMRWSKIEARILNTRGLNINGQEIPFRSAADNIGDVPPLVTRLEPISLYGYDDDAPITIKQTQPQPSMILTLSGVLEIGEP